MKSKIETKGYISCLIEYDDGLKETVDFNNSVKLKGKSAIGKILLNQVGDVNSFFINRMLFGDGGRNGGIPRIVEQDNNSLFGTVRVVKPVVSTANPNDSTEIRFSSTLGKEDGNGIHIDEMSLQMENGDLFSMATWPGFVKASNMQITFTWKIVLI